jgi:hypothetical protein
MLYLNGAIIVPSGFLHVFLPTGGLFGSVERQNGGFAEEMRAKLAASENIYTNSGKNFWKIRILCLT